MSAPALLACDWGTSNLRAWVLDEAGRVLSGHAFPGLGVAQIPRGDAGRQFAETVRPALSAEQLPAILCGMVGSTLGWVEAPYVDCPAAVGDLARRLMTVPDAGGPTHIVPGVRWRGFSGQGDVMRGEETQLFGWLALEPAQARSRQMVCHPGTHAKWMRVEDGRLTGFVTAMTGELFALLRRHSVLRTDAEVDDLDAFDAGVAAARDGSALAARLFGARARVVAGGADPASAASYLSGLLIGADVAATPRLLDHAPAGRVVLLGDAQLCALYARALAAGGVATDSFDGAAAAAAGLFALSRLEARDGPV